MPRGALGDGDFFAIERRDEPINPGGALGVEFVRIKDDFLRFQIIRRGEGD